MAVGSKRRLASSVRSTCQLSSRGDKDKMAKNTEVGRILMAETNLVKMAVVNSSEIGCSKDFKRLEMTQDKAQFKN